MKFFSKRRSDDSAIPLSGDVVQELRGLQTEADSAAAELRTAAESLNVRKLIDTAEHFGLAWSGSPLGYHSSVYIENFRPAGAGEHFSIEWGFNRAFSNTTAGRWREYTYQEVRGELLRRSTVDISALERAISRCTGHFDSIKDRAVSILDFLSAECSSDSIVKEVAGACKALDSAIGQSAIGQSFIGQTQYMSRDMRAVHQGILLAPHLAILAFAMHLESAACACEGLAKCLKRLTDYLARRAQSTMSNTESRVVAGGNPEPTPPFKGFYKETLRLLFVAANPSDGGRLALDNEMREISHKVARVKGSRPTGAPEIDIVSAWAAQPSDLLHALNEHRPDIVHFSGHGSTNGELIFTNQNGTSQPVTARALSRLFAAVKDNVRVVVLNACYSSIQAEAIKSEVDYVIGMTDGIGDRAAILFASTFYGGLSFGRTVREAFEQGVVALLLEDIPEEAVPTLLG